MPIRTTSDDSKSKVITPWDPLTTSDDDSATDTIKAPGSSGLQAPVPKKSDNNPVPAPSGLQTQVPQAIDSIEDSGPSGLQAPVHESSKKVAPKKHFQRLSTKTTASI